jgi:hypothetical protein
MPRYNLSLGNRTVTLAETDEPLSKRVGRRLAGTPDTLIDSGGSVNSYNFDGQEITRSELREIKEMRESGGVISMLVHAKALMNFGTDIEWVTENEPTEEIDGEPMTLTEWLEDTFDDLNSLVLDIGEDALWYPYGAAEIVETRGGGFSHVEPVEPWTILPKTDKKGNIVYWEQEIQGRNAEPQQYLPDEIVHFPINKSSARDKTGISAVLRSEEEIRQFRENQQAIASAIELHGFPQRHVKVGNEGSAPIRDNELRRIRNLFDSRTVDSDTVFVTGQDVDIEALEAENFDFADVTENDMRQLSLALGVPLELTNYGKDGLGSGKPAELRLELFKLMIKANQRNFTNIWVRDVIRPILRDYTPFNHTVNLDMNLQDPITGDDEMASIIQQVGEYMETNEARQKLNLEPKEELEGEYGPPGEDESGDGLDELFNESANTTDTRTLQDIEDIDMGDYPEAAVENARMALEAREETDNPNDCGTRVGWERANQLVNGEDLSEDTIERMAAFERHEDNKDQGEEGRADCGWMMWKAWGGDEGIEWAQRKSEQIDQARRENAEGDTDFSDCPEWDSHLLGMHAKLWESSDTRLLNLPNFGETPEFVKERIRDAINSGAVFSDIESLTEGSVMDLRQFLKDELTDDGWTITSLTEELQGYDPSLSRSEAETLARTETASIVNTAREEGYQDQGQADDTFYWTGSLDDRTTEACRWLIEQTNPNHGGEPVTLERLKELIAEAPEHDPEMQDNLARPENFLVHPNERKTFTRAPSGP